MELAEVALPNKNYKNVWVNKKEAAQMDSPLL
jgi:hypothetical protein